MRRTRKRLVRILCAGLLVGLSLFFGWVCHTYPATAEKAKIEEKRFWKKADRMTLEERSALLNHVIRTNKLPRVLPWWEYDNDLCAATVVKYTNLFTGVRLVQTSAWQLRSYRISRTHVSNSRKLLTVWDRTEEYKNGRLTPEKKTELLDVIQRFPFDPDKVYVLGLLWEETRYWEKIKTEGPDINSHVALLVRGSAVIHFIHAGPDDPLRMESLSAALAEKKIFPVWIAEVRQKSRIRTHRKLESAELLLPRVSGELAFRQNMMPWETIREYLVVPREPWFLPRFTYSWTKKGDALIEKSLLFHVRNGYDLYPTIEKRGR
ncbi:MAG TPA: hypothetical protein VJB99_02920 [Patescibacteria group bacterium]|nr:hypothetical protein [Patescibacteria group bacterium]